MSEYDLVSTTNTCDIQLQSRTGVTHPKDRGTVLYISCVDKVLWQSPNKGIGDCHS